MPNSKSIHFFATRHDLEAILTAVESRRPIKYTQAGMFDTPNMTTVGSGSQIPNLGFAPSGEHALEPYWLITDASTNVVVKTVPQRGGGVRYGIDPGLNQQSLVIWPGGIFETTCVVAGQIGTAMANAEAMELLKLFTHEIRRQFTRIKSFFVGPEAELLLDAGYRLTHGVKTAKESDLCKN